MFTLTLRTKRDAVLARQRARQAAALLRFNAVEQATIAAGAFAIALEALSGGKGCPLFMNLDHGALVIGSEGSSLRLVKPAPAESRSMPLAEFAWMLRQLEEIGSASLFEEFKAQNQEVLHLLHQLAQAHAEIQGLRKLPPTQAAA